MSDADVLRLVEEMEQLLGSDALIEDSEAVAEWHERFLSAVPSAEKGPGWPGIVERAHAIAKRIESTVDALRTQRDAIKQELETQTTGQRALKAYKTTQD
jgi:hypothetical protein